MEAASEAAGRIADGAVVSVSSSSALGCPDAVLAAIGKRFRAEGRPRDLTTLHPIAAGDMYGVKGIDHLAEDGLLDSVVAGSYPSGPSSLPMPKIWRMIVEDRVAAWNVPSGILFEMHRSSSVKGPGVMTQVGIGTFVDPDQEGCAMNPKARSRPIVFRKEFDGRDWLHFPNIPPDVAILRATTADEDGNLSLEHEGATLGGLDQAISAKSNGGTVIAQVKRMVAENSLSAREVEIPGHLVDSIVVDPDQRQTTNTGYDPSISGEIRLPWSSLQGAEPCVEKIVARRAALELRKGQTANLGFGISALVPQILLEEGYAGSVTWVIEQGPVGGLPLPGFAFGCAANPVAFLPSPNQFNYFQGGGFDLSFLSFLEVDIAGNVNVSSLSKKPYLTAGCGGFVDITARAPKIVFSGLFEAGAKVGAGPEGIRIEAPGKHAKFVDRVEQVTFSGERSRLLGQEVLIVTERCVIRPMDDGLEAFEIMPGIDPGRDITDASSGRVSIAADATETAPCLLSDGRFGMQL